MARLGYTGATLQLVPYKGELKLLYWSPHTGVDNIYDYKVQLDDYFESATDDEGLYVDKWNYVEEIHGTGG